MGAIMAGEATQAQIAGFLVALRAKGETPDEIAGCAEAMRAHVTAGRTSRATTSSTSSARAATPRDAQHLDRCGDRRRSGRRRGREARQPRRQLGLGLGRRARGARLRARAGAGADRRVDRRSSASGSCSPPPITRPCATPHRFAASSGPARSSTCSGRSTNPAGARAGVFGVYSAALVAHGAPTRSRSSTRAARSSCTASAGSTSSRPAGRTWSPRSSTATCATACIDPADYGIDAADPAVADAAARAAENAAEIRAILAGDLRGPKRDAVLLNAAGAIAAAGHAADLREGLGRSARDAVDAGARRAVSTSSWPSRRSTL